MGRPRKALAQKSSQKEEDEGGMKIGSTRGINVSMTERGTREERECVRERKKEREL